MELQPLSAIMAVKPKKSCLPGRCVRDVGLALWQFRKPKLGLPWLILKPKRSRPKQDTISELAPRCGSPEPPKTSQRTLCISSLPELREHQPEHAASRSLS